MTRHAHGARQALDPGLVAPGGRAGLDIDYALTLGDDAIPDLIVALAVVNELDQARLRAMLEGRARELGYEAEAFGPLSWNLSRERAREALAHLPGS